MITYKASGMVIGKCWGSGQGSYPASEIRATNKTSLVQQIENGIKDGSLDSGMGFEFLIGAKMEIKTIDTRKIDGKVFTAIDYENEIFGDMTPEQEAFLDDAFYS